MRRRPGELLALEVALLRALLRARAEGRVVWSHLLWGEVRFRAAAQTNSAVYRALERLARMGLATSVWVEGHRCWALTEDGARRARELRA